MDPEMIEKLKREAAEAAVKQFQAEERQKNLDAQAQKDADLRQVFADAKGNRGAGLEQVIAAMSKQGASSPAGAGIGKYVLAWAAAGGAVRGAAGPDRAKFAEIMKSFGHSDQSRVLQESVFAAGGSSVPMEFSNDWMEVLRPQLVLARLGAQTRRFKSQQQIGTLNSGPTAYWIAPEGTEITASTPSTGALILMAHKLAVRVDVSNDLLRNPNAMDAQLIASEMAKAAALEFENQCLNGTGASGKPRGLIAQVDPANVNPKSGTAVADYIGDIDGLVETVDLTDRPRERRGFLIHPTLEKTLLGLRDTGEWVFREELLTGRLRGFPCVVSTLCPSGSMIFGEFSDLTIGIDTDIELASTEAPRFSYDETSFRVVMRGDALVRRSGSFAITTGY